MGQRMLLAYLIETSDRVTKADSRKGTAGPSDGMEYAWMRWRMGVCWRISRAAPRSCA